MYFFCVFMFFLMNVFSCHSYEPNYVEDEHTMRIDLYRQPKPLEAQLNAPLYKYGIKPKWLYQKPTPKYTNNRLYASNMIENTEKEYVLNMDIDLSKPKPKPSNRTNDSIAIYRYLDHEFYGKIVLGHPGQTLNVAFDTTWSYTWVLSFQCNAVTSLGCYFHNKYNHYKSSEYKANGTKIKISEPPYEFEGFFSYENISFAHSNVSDFLFIEMVKVPDIFVFNKADGVMGLGLQMGPYEPFLYTLYRQKKLKNRIFSVYLNRNHQSDKGGNIMLGFYDKNLTKHDNKGNYDEIIYKSVDSTSYWQFDMDQIVMAHNKNKNETFCDKGCKAIVDTSTATIIGPQADVDKIHEGLQATKLIFNRYSVDCDRINELPKMQFVIGGKTFLLNGRSYITKLTWKSVSICLSAFQPAETEDEKDRWILGSSFLTEVLTIYDWENLKIGFARAA